MRRNWTRTELNTRRMQVQTLSQPTRVFRLIGTSRPPKAGNPGSIPGGLPMHELGTVLSVCVKTLAMSLVAQW